MKWHGIWLALIAAFTCIPVQPVQAFVATQQDYRWYVNLDDQTETDAWPVGATDLAEDTPITLTDEPPTQGDVLRVRMNILITGGGLSVAEARVRLQYGLGSVCSAISSWTDVGAIGSGEVWRFFDNPGVTDGSALTSLLLSSSNVLETYQESHPSPEANGVSDGEMAEWDFAIENNAAVAGASYCFRTILESSGTLDAYNNYPQLVTKPFTTKSQDWRWYGDEENETPTSSLAAANTRPIGIRLRDPIKLRMTMKEINGTAGSNQKFRLQFDTDPNFSAPSFVESIEACTASSFWCYADGVDADDDAITTTLLADAEAAGRHNETATSTSSFTHPASQAIEYEFTLKSDGASPNTLYYFRAYDANQDVAIELNTGESYPYLQTRAPLLSFTVEGLDAGAAVDSYYTNASTTAGSIDFGNVVPGLSYYAAQRLRVMHDGLGYQIGVYSTGPMITAAGSTIGDLEATNAAPEPWSFIGTPTTTGVFGYHGGDDMLSEGSTRFLADDTWAGLVSTPGEIVFTQGTVEDDVHDILYRLEVSPYQSAQRYTTEIVYVVVATY